MMGSRGPAMLLEEILWGFKHTLACVCYNIRMSTTQNTKAETPRPCCCVCGADHVDDDVRATEHGTLCVMCVDDVRADMAWDAHERDEDPYWEERGEY
jgi:hypothetical protein